MKVAGIVILYNPSQELFDNIASYIGYLDKLYVVDNTENMKSYVADIIDERLAGYDVQYIWHGKNKGIASSLNEVLDMTRGKYDWLLTMDQDSSFLPNSFKLYLEKAVWTEEADPQVAVIAPRWNLFNEEVINHLEAEDDKDSRMNYIERCITSGSLVKIDIAGMVGGFDEYLFIDEVDYEFCYRCKQFGYYILEYKKDILIHRLGDIKRYNFFSKSFSSLNEPPIRVYYIIRNRLYVSQKYTYLRFRYYLSIVKMMCKILLVEECKLKKMRFAFWGLLDYFLGKGGRFSHKI